MTTGSKVGRMARILIVALAAILAVTVAACAPDGSTNGERGADNDAESFKSEMDAEAKTLLPDLMSTLGGELGGMQATFYERGGFGIWDYTASGVFSRPLGTVPEKLDKATAVLGQHGFTVERDNEKRRVFGTKGVIGVTVQAGMPTTDPQVTSLNLRISNIGAISDGDDFAEQAPAEDYLAYLK